MLAELLKRRALILLGKGGVGKTTISAAIALLAARDGARVLVMECDTRAPLASLFGLKPSFEPVEAAANLSVMVLEGRHSLEEYLHLVVPGKMVLNAVFASRLYQYFVNAAPGLRELMMLGKFCYEIERKTRARPAWDLVVLDAPASGQALTLLKMPLAAHETFGQSIVGREAGNITRTLRDETCCAILQVTTPEPLALAETLETNAALGALGLKVATVILNRRNPAAFDADAVTRLARNPAARRKFTALDRMCDVARAELKRAAESRRALAQLGARIASPVVELEDHRGRSGRDLVEALSAELSGLRETSLAPTSERLA